MTTAGEYLDALRQYLGYTEEPRGSNHVPGITDWYGFNGPWCNMLVSKASSDSGLPHDLCAFVPTEVQRARDGNLGYQIVAPADIRAGDWLAHNLREGYTYDHIDSVEVRDGDALTCIDGNWGDACVRTLRNVNDWSIQNGAVIRPPYSTVAPPPPPPPPPPEDDSWLIATI